MTSIADDARQRIDTYLAKLRGRLRGFNDAEVREVVDELRSHIADKLATTGTANVAAVDDALAALGTPEELASQYITDNLLARAEVSRSPRADPEKLVPLGKPEHRRISGVARFTYRIFPGNCLHALRAAEAISSAHRWAVDHSRRRG